MAATAAESEKLRISIETDNTNNDMKSQGHRFEDSVRNSAEQVYDLCIKQINNINKRTVLIKNVCTKTTIKDIEDFVKGHDVTDIKHDEDEDKAVVVLNDSSDAVGLVQMLNNSPLLGLPVMLCLCPNPALLCVANLPQTFTEKNLSDLASQYGKIIQVFIMRSKSSGRSKGYGFVEFAESEERTHNIAKQLDWSEVEGRTVQVTVFDGKMVSWEKMQSRCLLIDNLPIDFLDIGKLRQMFSCVTTPVYCQIASREGKSLGYGIIEYRDVCTAEETWEQLNGTEIQEQPVSLTFCIPGQLAVFVYNRIMWEKDKKQLEPSTKSLLPDPVFVNPALMCSPVVKALTSQFPLLVPIFMKCLHQLHKTYISSVMSRNTKPGLLGPAPSLPAISPIINPNMQLGLIVFIALKMQADDQREFTGPLAKQLNLLRQLREDTATGSKPSLLGEALTAQANMLLQNLQAQLSLHTDHQDKFNDDMVELDSSGTIIQQNKCLTDLEDYSPKQEDNILTPMKVSSYPGVEMIHSEIDTITPEDNVTMPQPVDNDCKGEESRGGESKAYDHGDNLIKETNNGLLKLPSDVVQSDPKVIAFYNQHLQNITNLNFNALISLGQLLYSMQDLANTEKNDNQKFDRLLPNPSSDKGDRNTSWKGRRGSYLQDDRSSRNNMSQPYHRSGRDGRRTGSNFWDNNSSDTFWGANDNSWEDDDEEDNRKFWADFGRKKGKNEYIPRRKWGDDHGRKPRGDYGQNRNRANQEGCRWGDSGSKKWGDGGDINSKGNRSINSSLLGAPPSWQYGTRTPKSAINRASDGDYWLGSSFSGEDSGYGNVSRSNEPTSMSYSSSGDGLLPFPMGSTTSYNPPANDYSVKSTPVGQKRSYSTLLPEPEPSPEGTFVGQHSQGIGGHYADSYCKRQKLDHPF